MSVASLEPQVLDVSIRKDYVEIGDGAGAQTSVLTLKKNDYGLWQLVWPHGTVGSDVLRAALASGQDIGRWGMVFRQPGDPKIIASGPVTTVIDSEGRRNGIAGDAVSAWGVTDLTHLRERVVYPEPLVDLPVTTGSTGHQWSLFTRRKEGPAEDVALSLIRENIGAEGLARRRLPCTLVVPTSLGRGPVVVVAPTPNENVLEVVQQMMTLAGLVIDIVQTAPATLTVVVRAPQLRSGIVWSAAPGGGGTAAGVSIKASRRPKTDVVASGSGDDPDTVYVRRVAPAPPGGYSEVREEFIKGSGDEVAKLVTSAEEELVEDGPEYGLDVEPMEDAPWRLGTDYEVGDLAWGVIYDTDFQVPMDSVVLRHDEGTLVEEPSAAFADDFSIEPLVRRMLRRITRAER